MESVIQYRISPNANVTADVENRQIRGYGVVFESDSLPLPIPTESGEIVVVIEQITRDCIKNADTSDMLCSVNHNFEKILGRTSSGTMTFSIDDTGIEYKTKAGNQTYASDTLESIRRNDISGSSFVFYYNTEKGYEFTYRDDNTIIATPKEITKIKEMGPVVSPAYPGTTAQNRSDQLIEEAKRFVAKNPPGEKMEIRSSEGENADQKEIKKEELESEAFRAMDIHDMSEAVVSSFYRQFDYQEEYDYAYFYVQSVMLDNTMVVKENPSKKLWKLGFSISEDMSVTFDDRESWEQVQKEFVPVRAWEEKEAEKRVVDEKKEAQHRTDTTGFPAKYYEIKAIINKRV